MMKPVYILSRGWEGFLDDVDNFDIGIILHTKVSMWEQDNENWDRWNTPCLFHSLEDLISLINLRIGKYVNNRYIIYQVNEIYGVWQEKLILSE